MAIIVNITAFNISFHVLSMKWYSYGSSLITNEVVMGSGRRPLLIPYRRHYKATICISVGLYLFQERDYSFDQLAAL